jgi:hypothetical protein
MAKYTIYALPFSPRPQFISVRLMNVPYRFKLVWNIPADCWLIDIMFQDGSPLACGIPLVTGADLLTQLGYLEIGGQLLVISDRKPNDIVPSFEGLGLTGHVYFVPDNAQPV